MVLQWDHKQHWKIGLENTKIVGICNSNDYQPIKMNISQLSPKTLLTISTFSILATNCRTEKDNLSSLYSYLLLKLNNNLLPHKFYFTIPLFIWFFLLLFFVFFSQNNLPSRSYNLNLFLKCSTRSNNVLPQKFTLTKIALVVVRGS